MDLHQILCSKSCKFNKTPFFKENKKKVLKTSSSSRNYYFFLLLRSPEANGLVLDVAEAKERQVGWEAGFLPACCFNPTSKWHSRASPRNHPEASPWGRGDLGLHPGGAESRVAASGQRGCQGCSGGCAGRMCRVAFLACFINTLRRQPGFPRGSETAALLI